MPERRVLPVSGPRREWFRIENAASSRPVIRIYDAIGGWFGVWASELVEQLDAITAPELELRVNSPGGDVFEGLAIMNSLRAHPARVVAYVDGLAASAASYIVVGGADEVVMGLGTELMIHNPSAMTYGDAALHRDSAERLDSIADNLASIYASRAGGEVSAWRAAMAAETWYSAAEAVTAGLADRVDVMPEDPEKAKNAFDLTVFAYAGRSRAPAPGTGNPLALSVSFDVGDRVQVTIDPPHAEGQSTGTIAEIGTTAYGIVFDAMPEMGVHRWYVASELEPVTEADDAAAKKKPPKKPMKPMPGMSAPQTPAASADGSITTQEGSRTVAFTDQQLTSMRQELGLPTDADEATIVAALHEALAEQAEPPHPPTAALPPGTVTVDQATLDELRANAELGRAAHEEQQRSRREQLVNAAVSDGRIAPSRVQDWLNVLAADPGAEQTLASLAKGLIPLAEIGHAGNDADIDTEADALYAAVFGKEVSGRG